MPASRLPPPLGLEGEELTIGGVRCADLVETYGTPLYVMDEARIRENYRRLRDAFGISGSTVRLLYAVKANPGLAVLAVLHDMGAWADVSGPGEITLARAAGFPPDHILCTPSFPTEAELEYAVKAGVTVNLDDPDKLEHLASLGTERRLSLRVNPGFGKGGHKGIVTGGRGTKFGIAERDIVSAYRRARALGFFPFGLHAMTGSNVLDPKHFARVAAKLTEIAGRVAAKLGLSFEFIDLGGGLGIPYRPREKPLDVRALAKTTLAAFRNGCEAHGLGEPELWIEPGRYLVGDAGILLTRVAGIKTGEPSFVGVDAGMATLLRPALYDAYHEILPAHAPHRSRTASVTICGPICESTDVLARDRPLPHVSPGDILAIANAGAYGFAMASNYNGRPRPAEVLAHSGTHELIREAETSEDLLRGQRIPSRVATGALNRDVPTPSGAPRG